MSNVAKAITILIMFASTQQAGAIEGCGVSHQECLYSCIEYYPNGTDCKKSKKSCHEVCDDFDVHPSGDTPHVSPSHSPSMKTKGSSNPSVTPPNPPPINDINTNDLTPPTQNCLGADGKVYKCN